MLKQSVTQRVLPWSRAHGPQLVLGLIVAYAALVRIVSLNWGFPFLLHPDEPTVVRGAVTMISRHSFEPPWSMRPDHLEMEIDDLLFQAYSHLTNHPVVSSFAKDPLPFYWIARFATACFGIGSVVLAYCIGRMRTVRTGLIAAGLFAAYPGLVDNAHYATPDVPLTCTVLALIYALMRYVRSPRWPSLLWASFALAAGVAIKYPAATGGAVIGLTVLAVAIRDGRWTRAARHLAGAAAATVGFLFAISPVLFTDIRGVIHSLHNESEGDRLGNQGGGYLHNLWWYVANFGWGSLLIWAFVLLGGYVLLKHRSIDTVPWVAGLVTWISLASIAIVWQRWGLPMYVTPLLVAAVGVDAALDLRPRGARVVSRIALVVVAAAYVSSDASIDMALGAPRIMGSALDYMHANGITPADSVSDGHTPFDPNVSHMFFQFHARTVGTGFVFIVGRGARAQYAILSQGMYAVIEQGGGAHAWAQRPYQWVQAHATLIAQFQGGNWTKPSGNDVSSLLNAFTNLRLSLDGTAAGQIIQIYRLPTLSGPVGPPVTAR